MSLIYAVRDGEFKKVRKLIKCQDINMKFINNWTLIMYSKTLEITIYLIKKGANLSLQTADGSTALILSAYYAIFQEFNYIAKKSLLNIQDNTGYNAIYTGNMKRIALLCKLGCSIFIQTNRYKKTCIIEYDLSYYLQVLI